MSYAWLTNLTRGRVLGTRIAVADRWWLRLRGLLGRPPLGAGGGVLLTPCRPVHTFGLSYPVDVAFLDRRGAVVALYHRLAPGTASRWQRGAVRPEEHTSELQSPCNIVCRLLLEKKKTLL